MSVWVFISRFPLFISKVNFARFPRYFTHSLLRTHIDMGQRQNRKRTRHRPGRQRKNSDRLNSGSPYARSQSFPTAISGRYSYSPAQTYPTKASYIRSSKSSRSLTSWSDSSCDDEDPECRDMRIFGGLPEEQEESSDLRGPMIDVVLGLFNAIDYEDENC